MGRNGVKLSSLFIVGLLVAAAWLAWAPLATGASYTKYATNAGSEGWRNEGMVTGAPDDKGAESPIGDSLAVWASGFGMGTGTITGVVIKVVYRVDVPAVDDQIWLEYTLNAGESNGATNLYWVPKDTTWTEKTLDVTSDDSVNGGSWDWTDIGNLQIYVTNDSVGDPDDSVVSVDAIYIEVTTTSEASSTTATTTTPSFNFSVSASPASLSIQQTESASTTVSVKLVSGLPMTVLLSGTWAGTAPVGVTPSFSPPSGAPSFSSTLAFAAAPTATAGTFTYRVTGIGGGVTRTADVLLIVTKLAPPAAPQPLSPDDRVTLDTNTPTLDWADVLATTYTLELATDDGFSHTILTKTTNESTVVISEADSLSYGTTYYWRVRGTNAAGVGDWSPVRSFTAKIGAPRVMSFQIDAGVRYVNSTDVQLLMTALNSVEMSFSSDGITWGGWESFRSPKPYTLSPPDGVKTIYVRVRDAVGDIGQSAMSSVILDQTPPVTMHFLSGDMEGDAYKVSVVVTLIAEDATSEVGETKYRVDNGEWATGSTFVLARDGRHTVEYYSTDAAGNSEAAKAFEVTVFTPTIVPPIISQYWWAILLAILAVGAASTFAVRKARLANRLERIKKEKAQLPKLKREAEIMYFKKGSISRQTYDAMVKDYQRRKAELEKEEKTLLAKGKKNREEAKNK